MSLPPNFSKKLSERKVIPFVGAGVSMNVKDKEGNNLFPDWRNLLLASAERLKNNGKEPGAKLVEGNLDINPPDYFEAAKQAQKFLGSEFYDLIKEKISVKFENVDDSSLIIPRTIWEISNNLIVTTNYDKVLNWSCPQKEDLTRWNIQAPKEQADLIRTHNVQQPTIWHLHGHIDDVRNIILTPDGYERLYPSDNNLETKYQTALETLKNLFVSHTLLFVGFSLSDEYFVNQLKYVQNLFQGTLDKHYILIRESEKVGLDKLEMEIEPITFESFGAKMLEKLCEIKEVKLKSIEEDFPKEAAKTATERFNPKNRVVHIPFNQKGDQVVGREEDLNKVRKTLLEGFPTNIGQAVSFQGLGGLGKTQLAVEYAYKYQDEYPNGVIWLTVDQDIDKQLVEICDKAEWVSPKSEIKVKLDVARHSLKTITDCLIVLDNVETFDERIKNYLPAAQKDIHILATSRYELIGFNPVPLKLLTSEQSVQMLKQESRREIKDEAERKTVGQIAEELGFLPLALELAGGFMRYRDIGWENYLSLLKQNPREAFKEKFLEGSFTNHDKDVYRTLKVSETILNEEPILRNVLDLLTWSATSPMGIVLMSELLGENEMSLIEVLSLGDSLNLLQRSHERNAYAIHRLVAEVRKEDIPLAQRTDWIKSICQILGDWFQNRRGDFTKLPEYEAELEHLIKWQEQAKEFSFENVSRLLWLQAYPPYYRGEYNNAGEIVGKALEIHLQNKNENQETLANLYNDFGSVLGDLGKYQEQFDNQKKALVIRLELFGEKHPDTVASFNNVGVAYGELGKYQEQFDNQKKALHIRLELFGEKHPDTVASFNNVGVAYGELGKYQEQFDNQKKALHIRLGLFGEKHPDTATSFNNVGVAYGNLGKYKEQFDNAKKALDIQLEIFGEKHPDTARSFNNIGSGYGELGDYQKQFDNQKKALDIRLELFGEKHPDTATSLSNLSFHYQKNKDYKKATEYAEKSLNIWREVFGNFHLYTIASVVQLTTIYTEDKKGDSALRLVDEFLRIIPKSDVSHNKLENQKRWILAQTQRKGFRRKPINPAKKKRKKKRK